MQLPSAELVIALVVLFFAAAHRPRHISSDTRIGAALAIAGCIYVYAARHASNTFALHTAAEGMNEVLLLDARVAGVPALFMLDSGYAGPPVLSASYLAVGDDGAGSVSRRYSRAMAALERGVSSIEQQHGIDRFIDSSACITYTSSCTMRLQGIGSTAEHRADMLLCPMLALRTTSGAFKMPKRTTRVHADLFVTNPMPRAVHILTSDFLLHASPCLLDLKRGTLSLNIPPPRAAVLLATYDLLPLELSGGAFVVRLRVGGRDVRCTVDTGSASTISLAKRAAQQLNCASNTGNVLRQQGVNGERVCSQIVSATVQFCSHTFHDVPVLANDHPLERVDGYIGLGFLRAFNILITDGKLGFQKNGMHMRSMQDYSGVRGTCDSLSVRCARNSA